MDVTERAGTAKTPPSAIGAVMRLLSRRMRRSAALPNDVDARPLPVAIREARGILVVALAEAGDMVLLSPFLRELRVLAPAAHVALVCLPGSANLYEASTDVDELITYPASMRRILRPFVLPSRAREFAGEKLRGRFDVAIVPRWDTDHYFGTALALFSGARRRVGHTEISNPRRRVLNAGFDTLLTDVVRSTAVGHEVERHLALLQSLGAAPSVDTLALQLTESDRARAARELAPIAQQPLLVAFGIGAAHPKRRWPMERYAEVGRALHDRFGAHIVAVGGPGDVEAQDELLRALGPIATGVAGRLSLRETTAVLERCSFFVGNDSAPLHLAVAAGIPCVSISCHPVQGDPLHNNAPERFRPWRVPAEVLRPATATPPCTVSCNANRPHCILSISPEMVVSAAAALLQRVSAPASSG